MPNDDQNENPLGQSTDSSPATTGQDPGQMSNIPSSTQSYPPSPAPQQGSSSIDNNAATSMGENISTATPSTPATGSDISNTSPSSMTGINSADESATPLSTSGSTIPDLSASSFNTDTVPATGGMDDTTSTPGSILDPVSEPESMSPASVPGTPGNQISPPDNSSAVPSPTMANTIDPMTQQMSSDMGNETIPSIPDAGQNTSASGQPLHTSSDDNTAQPSVAPLKAPPMPGAATPEQSKDKKDENRSSGPPSPANVISSQSSGSGGGKFKIFVVLLVVVTIIVYAVVAYLYFTGDSGGTTSNLLGDSSVNDTQNQVSNVPTPTAVPAVTYEITINNGDVVSESSLGDITVLVKKNDYPESGIVGFNSVHRSSDGSKLCFYSLSPADDPSLYVSNSDGSSVTKVASDVSSCNWSPENTKLAYTNTSDSTLPVDIYLYDTVSDTTKNLTDQTSGSQIFRRYEITGWDNVGSKINCDFVEIDTVNTDEEVLGSCEIDVATSEVLDL